MRFFNLGFVTLFLLCLQLTANAQPLKDALANNDTLLALKLIKAGENINAYDSISGIDYLMIACRYDNNAAKVGFMLRHGARVDLHKSLQGRSALHVACAYYGCLNTIKLLVEYGADINIAARDGTTPLMLAAMAAKADVVAYLLQKGANAKAKDTEDKTALDFAMKSRDDEDTKKWIKCDIDKAATIKLLQQ